MRVYGQNLSALDPYLKKAADFAAIAIDNICTNNLNSCGSNSVNDGGFGNSCSSSFVFSTDFTKKCSPYFPNDGRGGYIALTNNATNFGFSNVTSHSGTNNILVVDGFSNQGSGGNNKIIWKETINNLLPGAEYRFSAFFINVNNASNYFPGLQFRIKTPNDVTPQRIGNPISLKDVTSWKEQCVTWTNSSNFNSIEIEISQELYYVDNAGNDFAIDDISFSPSYRPFTTSDYTVDGAEYFTNVNYIFEGNIRIPSGSSLSIASSTIQLKELKSIIIEKNATLTINNSTICGIKACKTSWTGIQVAGNEGGQANGTVFPGKVVIQNSTIANADYGVITNLGTFNASNGWSFTTNSNANGVVVANSATFVANRVGIDLFGNPNFSNYTGGNAFKNTIKNCTFLGFNSSFPFYPIKSFNYSLFSSPEAGIWAETYIFNDLMSGNNTFQGTNYGIRLFNSKISFNSNTFQNLNKGISQENPFYPDYSDGTILNNIFNSVVHGIAVDGQTNESYASNIFNPTSSGTGSYSGILLNNTGPNNQIYSNTFNNLKIGVWSLNFFNQTLFINSINGPIGNVFNDCWRSIDLRGGHQLTNIVCNAINNQYDNDPGYSCSYFLQSLNNNNPSSSWFGPNWVNGNDGPSNISGTVFNVLTSKPTLVYNTGINNHHYYHCASCGTTPTSNIAGNVVVVSQASPCSGGLTGGIENQENTISDLKFNIDFSNLIQADNPNALFNFLDTSQNLKAKIEYIPQLIEQGNLIKAKTLLNVLSNNNINGEYTDFILYYGFIIDLRDKNRELKDLNSNDKLFLENLAYNSLDPKIKSCAQSYLGLVFGSNFQIENNSDSTANKFIATETEENTHSSNGTIRQMNFDNSILLDLKNEQMVVSYHSENSITTFRVIDVAGREIYNLPLNRSIETQNINLNQLIAGIYLYQIVTEKHVLKSDKFIVQ